MHFIAALAAQRLVWLQHLLDSAASVLPVVLRVNQRAGLASGAGSLCPSKQLSQSLIAGELIKLVSIPFREVLPGNEQRLRAVSRQPC
jgi:hypothetical protein